MSGGGAAARPGFAVPGNRVHSPEAALVILSVMSTETTDALCRARSGGGGGGGSW